MNENLEDVYLKAQRYLSKNSLDLEIPSVRESISYASRLTRTPCRNFWTSSCEVTHASFSIRLQMEYVDFFLDPVDFVEFYICDGYWAANFLVASPKKPLTKAQKAQIAEEADERFKQLAKNSTKPFVMPSTEQIVENWKRRAKLSFEEREAEKQAELMDDEDRGWLAEDFIKSVKASNERAEIDYQSRLKVVGGTRLWKVSKTALKDAVWLRELSQLLSNRKVSLFHPLVKIRWDENHYHEPWPDPQMDPEPQITAKFISQQTLCINELEKYFYID